MLVKLCRMPTAERWPNYYLAKSLFQMEHYDEAIKEYGRAADAGYGSR